MCLTDDELFCDSLTMTEESVIYFGEDLLAHTSVNFLSIF